MINWLPSEALLSIRTDLAPAQFVHRLHSTALAVPPAIAVSEIMTGTYAVMGTGLPLAVLLVIAVLHPAARDLVRVRGMDRVMTGFVLVAAVPWIAFAIGQAGRGRARLHGEVEHWTFMAALSMLILVWGLIGASDRSGWRLPAWAAAVATAIVALKSLIFPQVLSGLPLPWAVVALVWAGSYLIAAEVRVRRR